MIEVDTADLALLALAGDDPGPESDRQELSVVELGERLEMGAETMADRIALLSALSELEDSGLVDEREAPGGVDERGSPGGTVYALTSRGRERATALYADSRTG